MDIFIRPAGPADAEAIARVQRESWAATYAGQLSPQSLARVESAWDAPHWRRSLERTDDRAFTLVVEGREEGIIGFGVAGPRRGRNNAILDAYAGEFYLLYLLPRYQRRSHGVRLMAAMARVLRARGMNSAVVWALSTNGKAVGFYQHLSGSILMQARKPFFGELVNEIALGWEDLEELAATTPTVRE